MAEAKKPLFQDPCELDQELLIQALTRRIAETEAEVCLIEESQRVSQSDMRMSFCICGGRCGKGANG
jgi:hypothetical protein